MFQVLNTADWGIVIGLLALVTGMAVYARRYVRSVADFMVANRCAGRYVYAFSRSISDLGTVTFLAWWELFYKAGFVAIWWDFMNMPIFLIMGVTGWVTYRFRQTRCMTVAQFYEIRYSRRFRIFMGMLAFGAGIFNFGIFPSIGARFIVSFCGLPPAIILGPVWISSFALVMFFLLAASLFFTFIGGQITVIVSDFIHGVFICIALLIICLTLFHAIGWDQIAFGLSQAPAGASLIHPKHSTKVEGFNIWYFLVYGFTMFYAQMAWQGSQGYYTSAKTPHEGWMGQLLYVLFSNTILRLPFLLCAVCAFVVLHHPDFAVLQAQADQVLAAMPSEQIASQMRVPVALRCILPHGALGLMCAVGLAGFVTTHNTYLHAWGSIFIQDIYMPFCREPLSTERHIRLLKRSICGVALFIFVFSLLFPLKQDIFMFFAVTGTIYIGGAGSVIIGGLYWKRGTTAAAWTAMIAGSVLSVAGVVLFQHGTSKQWLKVVAPWLNGQTWSFIAMATAITLYIIVSLLGKRSEANLDKILHRGRYAVQDDLSVTEKRAASGLRSLLIGKEHSLSDKFIYYFINLTWPLCWFAVFVIGSVYMLTHGISDASWMSFWKFYVVVMFAMTAALLAWALVGGLRDFRDMFRILATRKRDATDDGLLHAEEPPTAA